MKIRQRIKAAAAAVSFMACTIMSPPGAGAFEIDSSKFTNPKYQATKVYVWREGLPPTTTSAGKINTKEYKMLAVWDDQYYMKFNNEFSVDAYRANNETMTSQEAHTTDIYYKNGNYNDGKGYYKSHPHGVYWYQTTMDTPGTFSDFDFSGKDLVQYGGAISLKAPNSAVPVIRLASNKNNDPHYFILNYNYGETMTDGGAFNFLKNAAPNNDDYRLWRVPLYGIRHVTNWVRTESYIFFDADVDNVTTCRFVLNNFTSQQLKSVESEVKSGNFDRVTWSIKKEYNGYKFYNQGMVWKEISRISNVVGAEANLRAFIDSTSNADMIIGHQGKNLIFSGGGDSVAKKFFKYSDGYHFKVFYGDEVIMNMMTSDFTVEDGQVTTLSGPVILREGITVTVKDGGVLSVSDWVINNGTINVEEGGTLLIEKDSSLSRQMTNPDTAAGGVVCKGTLMVSSNAKLYCGGTVGLRLESNAQCINYGAILADNAYFGADKIIENRGSDSCVYVGKTFTGDSYALHLMKINGSINSSQLKAKTRSRIYAATSNPVTGEGAKRIYVNDTTTRVSL